ncbi:MAG: hydrogenase maturation protease [Ignavibacteriales bacterium]|nr:hydrogenase maturation protease [Ignavibacteriales bacterium]
MSSAAGKRTGSVTVIGIGNEYRSDDGIGLIIARRVKEHALPFVDVQEAGGEGSALVEMWRHREHVIIIDAISSGAKTGTLHKFHPYKHPLPVGLFHLSSHAFGLAEAIEMSRALNVLPEQMIVYGIEGECFEPGIGLSAAVNAAVDEIVEEVLISVRDSRSSVCKTECEDGGTF